MKKLKIFPKMFIQIFSVLGIIIKMCIRDRDWMRCLARTVPFVPTFFLVLKNWVWAVDSWHLWVLTVSYTHLDVYKRQSADGNITRLDNALEKMPEKLNRLEEKLISTKEQLENAKRCV